jgi:hypothetical protein
VWHKGDTFDKVLGSSPSSVIFIKDLVGPLLASWNALLQHLDFVRLTQEMGEFRWNLNENGKFSVDSIYIALIQPIEMVVNNKDDLEDEDNVEAEGFCVVSSSWYYSH